MIVAVGPVWQSKAATVEELARDLNALVHLIGDSGTFFDIDDAGVFTEEARAQYFNHFDTREPYGRGPVEF
jgi:hypothetical protein